jgi:hypothetical protein
MGKEAEAIYELAEDNSKKDANYKFDRTLKFWRQY